MNERHHVLFLTAALRHFEISVVRVARAIAHRDGRETEDDD